MRNILLKIILLILILCANCYQTPYLHAQTPMTQKDYEEDFDVFWKEIEQSYAYFDHKQTDWDKVQQRYRPRIASVRSRKEFVSLLEQAMEELYDFHCNLNTNTEASAVLVPTDADLWAKWKDGRAIITEVRAESPASKAGIKAGSEIVSIDDVPVAQAIAARMGSCLRMPDHEAENWALLTLLAGRHNKKRQIEILQEQARTTFTLDTAHHEFTSPLEYATIGTKGEIGYIRLHNSLGDNQTIADFDKALEALKHTKGMILDLRETPSGGNTTVARGIMGRFITKEAFYQKHSSPVEARLYGVERSWVEIVSPRGPFCYGRPLVVLVDHWTGSMGEGITIGFDAMKRARIVGTPMARLLGATDQVTLPHSQIGVHFPTEKLFQPGGKPREAFIPPVSIDLTRADFHSAKDPILEAGIKALKRQ